VTLNTTPIGHVLAESPGGINIYAAAPSNLNAHMNASAILPEGGSLPHNNIMPYLSLNWIVAWQGVFPSRG